MSNKNWNGEKKEGYELLKPGRSFIGPRPFLRAKDVVIKKGDKKETLKNINKNSYVPKSLIPEKYDMSCFEGYPVEKAEVKKQDKK